MPRIMYKSKKFRGDAQNIIACAMHILEEYAEQGYDLTLRQLFYQFVSRDLLSNTDKSYDKLGRIVSEARLAGYIDWDSIVDRTRNVRRTTTWESPSQILKTAAEGYYRPRWETQDVHVEVWIEKDALLGVIEGVCGQWLVPYFSCRGYTSQSEMWNASQRLYEATRSGKSVVICHLGDHDPSGIDMTRDIEERIGFFMASDKFRDLLDEGEDEESATKEAWRWMRSHFAVNRLALTMRQVREFNPPPNPAKLTDARARSYIEKYGRSSWELDALPPATLTGLIEDAIKAEINWFDWNAEIKQENEERQRLLKTAREWE